MKEFILNLLPRLKKYSETLDQQELFVEQPWVVLDEDGNKQQYIFRRNGRLMMSLNGKGTEGKWELIPNAQSMWIDMGEEKLLLNHAFFNRGVMLLKRDGYKGDIMVLANPNVVPNLNIAQYLQQFIDNADRGIRERNLTDVAGYINNQHNLTNEQVELEFLHHSGATYYIRGTDSFNDVKGKPIFYLGMPLEDGSYVSRNDRIIKVERGIITLSGYLAYLENNRGRFNVITDASREAKIGNQIFFKKYGDITNDYIKVYRSGYYDYYHVQLGKIVDIKEVQFVTIIIGLVIVLILILVGLSK